MSFKEKIKPWFLKMRWFLIGGTVGITIIASAFFIWQEYSYRTSPAFNIYNVNDALTNANMNHLAKLVDFRTLTEEFAKELLKNRPRCLKITHFPDVNTPVKPEEEVFLLSEAIQRKFIFALLDDIGKHNSKVDENEEVSPTAPIEPWPADFVKQLTGKIIQMPISKSKDNKAKAMVSIHYPRLNKKFNIIFNMEKGSDWRIVNIENAKELIQEFIMAEKEVSKQRNVYYTKENSDIRKSMDKQFTINQCTTAVNSIHNNKAKLLTIYLEGVNNGPYSIHNFTFDINIKGKDVSYQTTLNFAARILVGSYLETTQQLDLDLDDPVQKMLASSHELECIATPRTMTLGNKKVLHIQHLELENFDTE